MTKSKRILLVEDEEIILADLARSLRKRGMRSPGPLSRERRPSWPPPSFSPMWC